MKGTWEEVVIDVTPNNRTLCPCCGVEGNLVRAGVVDRQSVELRVEVVVDVPRARHAMVRPGVHRFEVHMVERLRTPEEIRP